MILRYNTFNKLGGGGGGKILLNCTAWGDDPLCFDKGDNFSYDVSSGDPGIAVPGAKYYVTMRMLQLERDFLFNGSKNGIKQAFIT